MTMAGPATLAAADARAPAPDRTPRRSGNRRAAGNAAPPAAGGRPAGPARLRPCRAAAAILLIAAALLAAPPAAGEAPLSAIPWLSDSLQTRPEPRPLPRIPRPAAVPADDPDGITVTPLPAASRDAVGLLPAERTGFPRRIWGPVSALRARQMILDHPYEGVPEARALFRRLLLAETDPPLASGPGSIVLLARLDRLMEIGALEEAEALLMRAGAETPEQFRRWFDIGLLLERPEAPCAALRVNPQLSPTLQARVFCLARGGDWNAAEITLTLGTDLGEIPADQERMLAWFLDPDSFHDAEPPPVPAVLTPLDFVTREAVGLPRPQRVLPAAFLHADLHPFLPMRSRIEAAERLVALGASPPALLFGAYRQDAPAASGGLWDRARAVQTLDQALVAGDAARLSAALLIADQALSARGLRLALAEAMAERLAAEAEADLTPEARRVLLELVLLAGDPALAIPVAGDLADDPWFAFLLRLAGALPAETVETAPSAPAPGSDRSAWAQAIADALMGPMPDTPRLAQARDRLEEGRFAEVLLEALALLAGGPTGDPRAGSDALAMLRLAGLDQAAARIALQTLLLPPSEAPPP